MLQRIGYYVMSCLFGAASVAGFCGFLYFATHDGFELRDRLLGLLASVLGIAVGLFATNFVMERAASVLGHNR